MDDCRGLIVRFALILLGNLSDHRCKERKESRLIAQDVMKPERIPRVTIWDSLGGESNLHQCIPGENTRNDERGYSDPEEPEEEIILRVDRTDCKEERDEHIDTTADGQFGCSPAGSMQIEIWLTRRCTHGSLDAHSLVTAQSDVQTLYFDQTRLLFFLRLLWLRNDIPRTGDDDS